MRKVFNSTRKLFFRWLGAIFIPVAFFSCNATKYVPDDQYLLQSYSIKVTGVENDIKKEEIKNIVKQKPNKKILGLRFHLWLYNLSKKKKHTDFDAWFRRIGEAPVVFSPLLTQKSAEQIKLYLQNKGYYVSEVRDTIILKDKKQKAKVKYKINVDAPYTINNVAHSFEDSRISGLILKDTINTHLKKGQIFEMELLQKERERIERLLKNNGYYRFNKEYVFYEVDSAVGNRNVNILLQVTNAIEITEQGETTETPHHQYIVQDVYISPNIQRTLRNPSENVFMVKNDTFLYNNLHFIYNGERNLKPGILSESNFVTPGKIYNLESVDRTYRRMSGLKMFRSTSITFSEIPTEEDSLFKKYLVANINLVPHPKQSYSVEAEGTNSGGNLGFGGAFTYQHKNLFKGAELLDLSFTGAMEFIKTNNENLSFDRTIELGAEGTFLFQRFLLPFNSERIIKKYNPKTTLTFAYNYQQLQYITSTSINSRFGYVWKGSDVLSHNFTPLNINAVDAEITDEVFQDRIDRNRLLKERHSDHIVSAFGYNVIWNTQKLNRNTRYHYLRFNIETAGNLMFFLKNASEEREFDTLSTGQLEPVPFKLLNIPFSQYIKTDVDFRYSLPLNLSDNIITHFFAGIAAPYLNSNTVPFERQYTAGGANDIRAWPPWSLGPGRHYDEDIRFQTGDIKLLWNLEYRYKLFWILEGAFFLDVGNIWSLRAESLPGSKFVPETQKYEGQFDFKTFYNELAWGTGFGLRWDFSFFLLRFDIGYKLYDPAYQNKFDYMLSNTSETGLTRKDIEDELNADKFNIQFGIGYPF